MIRIKYPILWRHGNIFLNTRSDYHEMITVQVWQYLEILNKNATHIYSETEHVYQMDDSTFLYMDMSDAV